MVKNVLPLAVDWVKRIHGEGCLASCCPSIGGGAIRAMGAFLLQ